jgi:hypothetical protein
MNTQETLKICRRINRINKLYYTIEKNKKITDLKKLYEYTKTISKNFYNEELDQRYEIVKNYLEFSSYVFNKRYILPISFELKELVYTNDLNDIETIEFIINETRKYLLELNKIKTINYEKKYKQDFCNYCQIASETIKKICDALEIKCKIINIEPGYDKEARLYNNNGFHYFNIIELNEKGYIVDLTYKQFFKQGQNCLESIGLIEFPYPVAGCFILMTEEGKEIAKNLLEKGYTRLSNESFKTYLDAFTVSFRNGLYYEQTKDYSYKTNYTAADYINFLEGTDSQTKHEGKEVLGYQKRPLK